MEGCAPTPDASAGRLRGALRYGFCRRRGRLRGAALRAVGHLDRPGDDGCLHALGWAHSVVYATSPYACSYLVDSGVYALLVRSGFRRSGIFVYRPHCEGCGRFLPVADMTLDEWRATIAVNLDSVFFRHPGCAALAGPVVARRHRQHVVHSRAGGRAERRSFPPAGETSRYRPVGVIQPLRRAGLAARMAVSVRGIRGASLTSQWGHAPDCAPTGSRITTNSSGSLRTTKRPESLCLLGFPAFVGLLLGAGDETRTRTPCGGGF